MLMKNSETNPIMTEIVKIAQVVEKTVIHECPYTDFLIDKKPVEIDSLPSIFPQGDYRITMNVTNRKEEQMMLLEFIVIWYSSEKHSFGK